MEPKYYKYVFTKDVDNGEGVIREGSELYYIHGCLYFEGGLIDPYYEKEFRDLIEYEDRNGYKVLRPVE